MNKNMVYLGPILRDSKLDIFTLGINRVEILVWLNLKHVMDRIGGND